MVNQTNKKLLVIISSNKVIMAIVNHSINIISPL
jgi:hypothetical protein